MRFHSFVQVLFPIVAFNFLIGTTCLVNGQEEGEKECAAAAAAPPPKPPQQIAMELATGNWAAQATRAFVSSGLAAAMEKLSSGDDNNTFISHKKIAKTAKLNPDATYRLLRYLASLGVCIEHDDDRAFALSPVGEILAPHHPASIANKVLWEAGDTLNALWSLLGPEFLKTNQMVAKTAFGGETLWGHLEKNPELFKMFGGAMTGYTNEEAFFLSNPDLSPTFDLTGFGTVCDLGSGEGTLSKALAGRFPQQEFILSDYAETLDRVQDLPDNFSKQAGDFLKSAPTADAYLLKHIIHDWDDKGSSKILKNIKKANNKATAFIIEFGPMPGANEPHLAKGFDLLMGISFGASERTQDEYNALYKKNGFELVTTHSIAGGNYPLYIQEIRVKG